MHRYDAGTEVLAEAVMDYSRHRMSYENVPLDGPRTAQELESLVGATITPGGLGGEEALRLFAGPLAESCISIDNPRYLSFIPCAPTKAATLFDLVVSATSPYAGTWMEGSGAVFAENQALAWLIDLAGLPASAGGVFVPGGTFGNLSALVAARYKARLDRAANPPAGGRWAIAGTANTHSSIISACDVMDVDFIGVPVGDDGRLTGEALRATLADAGHDGVFAVVGTAGTTNLGIIDDLDSIAGVCAELGLWFHVDGAYGLAGLAAPSVAGRFAGIERADSFVVDPHKWLFAPFDCCALVYRNPAIGRAAHTQRAGYLDVLTEGDEMNPADHAIGLTRRARGLPFWFSLATHGTQAYTAAVERTLTVARYAADRIRANDDLELLHEPELSVVCFHRRGWSAADYRTWTARLLAEDIAFVVSTTHHGRTVTRLAIVNPETTEADIDLILSTMF